MTQPQLIPDTRRNRYRLAEPTMFWLLKRKSFLVVDAGVLTDGASIPRAFWSVIGSPFEPDLMAGAFVHDCLYASRLLTRKDADEELYARLRETISKRRARIIWLAVRAFGWVAWNGKHKASVKAAREKMRLDPQ